MSHPLLSVSDVTVQYETSQGDVTAVSDASFTIEAGEYFGLVGESGCGKSTLAKTILGGLDDNGKITSGEIRYQGTDISEYTNAELNQSIRWKEISLIPQSSMNSLDPLQRIKDQAIEIADVHTDLTKQTVVERLRNLFDILGLQPDRISDYPDQFSGGMQQRAMIALALILEPNLVIADEPTTALDVVMQDQIFNYLDDIQEEMNMSMLLITHDISLVFESCSQMAVMHAGQVAERGSVDKLYHSPHHPYAMQLQQAFPDIRFPDRALESIEGNPPVNVGEVNYCTFAERCPWAVNECYEHAPELEPVDADSADHHAACFRKDDVGSSHAGHVPESPGIGDAHE